MGILFWGSLAAALAGPVEDHLPADPAAWPAARQHLVSELSPRQLTEALPGASFPATVAARAALAWQRDPASAAAVWSLAPRPTRAGAPRFDPGSWPGDVVLERLWFGGESPPVRRALVDLLTRQDPAWVTSAVGLLAMEADPEVREVVAESLRYGEGTDTLPAFRQAFADPDARVRAAAARAAGWSPRGDELVPELLAALEQPGVAGAAARSLGWRQVDAAVPALEALLVRDPPAPSEDRVAALRALARLDGPRAASLAARYVADVDPALARAASALLP